MRSRYVGFLAILTPMVTTAALLSGCGGDKNPPVSTPQPASSAPASTASGAAAGSPGASLGPNDWPMYHGTPDHAGHAPGMPAAGAQLTRIQSLKLDGPVYASPLVIHAMTIVATENDSVYAFNQAYQQVWKQNLGSPSPREERQCGDIDPLGITGTPIYDAATNHIFAVAELNGSVRHELVALDPGTGAVAWTKSVDLPGVSPRDMQQRGALAITGGKVWVSYGAQAGDCGDYKGRVVGVPLDGGDGVVSYTPETKRGGGIWNPMGPTVDHDGNLLVVSANGAGFPGDAYDHTNTVLKLDGSAKLLDSFAPSDWAENNRGDVGLGSQGVALVGGYAVLGGKSGPVYALRPDHLGGIGGAVSQPNICKSFGGSAVSGNVVYLPCTDGVRAVQVDSGGQLKVLWHADGSINGSPVVGGGRVWVLDYDGGTLHALDPATGKSVAQVSVGQANRFATPALAGANVIVGTLAGVAVVKTS
jgi:outer membrane protein assembly factor BamB